MFPLLEGIRGTATRAEGRDKGPSSADRDSPGWEQGAGLGSEYLGLVWGLRWKKLFGGLTV